MNILFVIPTLQQGGAERVMSELANEFVNQQGITVHLVLLADSKDFYQINKKVIVHRLGFKNTGKIRKLKSEISTFFKLRNLLKKQKPTAVLSFMEKYNVFTLLASSFLGLKIFVSDRSNPRTLPPFHIYLLRKFTYKNAAGVIAQTSLAKEQLWKQTKNNNIKIIPNPLRNVILFPEVPKEKLIINVGRLVPEKGQKYLLEAFSLLNAPEWKLVILGDGPLLQSLIFQAKKLNILDRLIMPGAVKNVDEWLARSSIFAFSSISEGFPNALIEAMAAGLPCVSFDCDAGPRDIIENGRNGFLVPNADAILLAKKLDEIINNPGIGDHASNIAVNVRTLFSKNKISKDVFNFITNHEITQKTHNS
ncbi:glycosyltransferase [Advenella alkanexedens]|uniref:glycosyltransferase n=1 Tax=Advenella alkanexedens TaxID=1481665 RepID=UPI002676B702|nr:glycosyltransferase [Advenella alkanexedens]WKU19012.1 glycosyltransferase [Advenella alkanexedens]